MPLCHFHDVTKKVFIKCEKSLLFRTQIVLGANWDNTAFWHTSQYEHPLRTLYLVQKYEMSQNYLGTRNSQVLAMLLTHVSNVVECGSNIYVT